MVEGEAPAKSLERRAAPCLAKVGCLWCALLLRSVSTPYLPLLADSVISVGVQSIEGGMQYPTQGLCHGLSRQSRPYQIRSLVHHPTLSGRYLLARCVPKIRAGGRGQNPWQKIRTVWSAVLDESTTLKGADRSDRHGTRHLSDHPRR